MARPRNNRARLVLAPYEPPCRRQMAQQPHLHATEGPRRGRPPRARRCCSGDYVDLGALKWPICDILSTRVRALHSQNG